MQQMPLWVFWGSSFFRRDAMPIYISRGRFTSDAAKGHFLVIFCIRGLSRALTCSAYHPRFLLHAMKDHRKYR